MAQQLSAATFVIVFAVLLGVLRRRRERAEIAQNVRSLTAPSPYVFRQSEALSLRAAQPGRAGRLLTSVGLLGKLQERIWQAGADLTVAGLFVRGLVLFAVGTLAGRLYWKDFWLSVATGAVLSVLPFVHINLRRTRRLKAFVQQLPHALDMLRSSLEAGHSMLRGLQVVAEEFSDPLGSEFRVVMQQTRVGLPLPEALTHLFERMPEQDLWLLITAVRMQSEVGSSLANIIGRLAEVIRARQGLRLQVRALTAQARIGGMVVAILPIFVLAAFSLVEPKYVHMLLYDPAGLTLLKIALTLDVLALLAIRRLTRVEF